MFDQFMKLISTKITVSQCHNFSEVEGEDFIISLKTIL